MFELRIAEAIEEEAVLSQDLIQEGFSHAFKAGEFPLQENSFFVEGERFLIRERKKQKGKKTQFYLIRLQPFQYVSSLFPTGEEESYTFDYEQKLYRLERKEHSVTLKFV